MKLLLCWSFHLFFMGTEGEGKKTPTVLWAQRADVVFLTIEVPDVDKESAVVKVRSELFLRM